MELSECGGTHSQSQHSGVSAGGESEVKTSLRYITRVCLKKKKPGEVIRWIMTWVWKWNSVTAAMKNCRNIKTFTENVTLSLAPLLLLGLIPLDKSLLYTRPCLRLSLQEAAMICVAFPLCNISPAFLYVLIKALKSHKLKNSWWWFYRLSPSFGTPWVSFWSLVAASSLSGCHS